MSKEVVQLGADVSELLKAFKDVKTQFASVTKALSSPIAIKIDTKSLDALAKSIGKQFGAVGKDISTAINKGNKDIVKGIGDVRKAISTIGLDTNKVADKIVKDLGSVGKKATAAAKKAGTSMGQAVAAGASAGVAPLGSKLENQLEAVFDRINRRIANLNKRKGSNFAVAQMREQLRQLAAQADPGGNMGIVGKGGQIPPGLFEALGIRNFAGKKGPVAGLDTATITRINGILSDTEKQVSATNANSKEFSAATRKSVERHERNEARKAAIVDKSHAQAIAMLERERIATEKAHAVANKMVSGERATAKAAAEKKHLADVQDFVNHQRRIFKARLAADEQEARNKKKSVDLTNRINDSYQQALDRARALLRAQPARLSSRIGGAEAFASIGYTPESLIRTRRNGTSFVSADRAQEVRNSTRGLMERLEKAPRNGAFTKDDTARANQMLTAHKGISASITESSVRMLKWFVTYKLFSDITNQLQRGLSAIAQKGLEYYRTMELQRIALRGILAENFKVADINGQQLTGAAAMAALQGKSLQQWKQLQSASLAVVGTTADLMLLYNSILPYASRLGKGLGDVQAMTKASAQAAALMNISFQDARSAITSMLRGNFLGRNKLVAALGVTEKELKSLKGTAAIFDYIYAKLDAFTELSEETQGTFGALSEAFEEFTGFVGSAAMEPFINTFTSGVKALQDILFEAPPSNSFVKALEPRPEVLAFFGQLKATISQALAPSREFVKGLIGQQRTAFEATQALGEIIAAVVKFIVFLTEAGITLGRFIASNQVLIRWMAYLAAAFASISYLKSWGLAIAGLSAQTSALGRLMQWLTQMFPGIAAGLKSQAAAATGAATGMRMLGGAMAMVATGLAGGIIIAGLSMLVSKLFQVQQRAEAAGEAIEALNRGDHWAAIAASNKAAAAGDDVGANRILGDMLWNAQQNIPKLTSPKGTQFSVNTADQWSRELVNEKSRLEAEKTARAARITTERDPAKVAALHAQANDTKKKIQELDSALREAKSYVSDLRMKAVSARQGSGAGEYAMFERNLNAAREALVTARAEAGAFGGAVQGEGDGSEFRGAQDVIARREAAVRQAEADLNKAAAKYGLGGTDKSMPLLDRSRQAERRAREAEEAIDRNVDVLLSPNGLALEDDDAKPARGKTPTFHSFLEPYLGELESYYDKQQAIVEAGEKAETITMDAAASQQEALLRKKLEARVMIQRGIKEQFETWLTSAEGKKAAWDTDKIEEERQRLLSNVRTSENELEKQIITDGGNEQARKIKLQRALEDTYRELAKKGAEVSGVVGEKVDAEFEDFLQTRLESLKGASQDVIDKFVADAEALRIPLREKKELEDSARKTTSSLEMLERQQELVDQQFQSGRLGIRAYVEQMEALRSVQSDSNLALIGIKTRQRDNAAKTPGNEETVANLNLEIAALQMRLAALNDRGEMLRKTFDSFGSIVDRFGSITESLGFMGEGFKFVTGHVQKAFKQIQDFVGLFGEVRAFIAQFQAFRNMGGAQEGPAAIGGISGLVAMATNAKAPNATGAAGAAGGASTGAVLAGIGAAAGIAIGIATSLYARAVESARKRIQKTMEDLTKSIANGTVTLGEGLARAERERRQTEIQMSKSKSGRKAWKEEKQAFDDMIQDMKDKIQDIRDSFDDQLKTLRLGDGPYADFAKDLMELELRAKEYLETFTAGTEEYNQALQNITEMWNLTLANAKRNLESQMMSFEGEALASAQRVIDLIDERKQLQDDLGNINKQRKDLDEDWAEIAEDERDEWRRFQKEREAYQERILDLQKQISDSIRQAAQDEADIRRRGVLEAQETVAVKKAREIAKVREDAADEIADLKKQLASLTSDPDERIDQDDWNERAKQLLERREALEERRKDLAHREGQIRDSIKLNQIRLTGAKQIAGIEGTIFDISGDRFELESKRMNLEVGQAKVRVQMWRETAALVEAIAKSGDGFMFNVPPGFPQVRIQIGNIIIDNSDNSSTSNNGGGGGNGPGTPGDPGMKDPRQKPPKRPGYDWYWDHNLNTWVEYKTGKPEEPYPHVDPDGRSYTKAGRQGYY